MNVVKMLLPFQVINSCRDPAERGDLRNHDKHAAFAAASGTTSPTTSPRAADAGPAFGGPSRKMRKRPVP